MDIYNDSLMAKFERIPADQTEKEDEKLPAGQQIDKKEKIKEENLSEEIFIYDSNETKMEIFAENEFMAKKQGN